MIIQRIDDEYIVSYKGTTFRQESRLEALTFMFEYLKINNF